MFVEPIGPSFAAEASGVELRKPLDAATVRAIEAAMDKYAVLVFRGQPLTRTSRSRSRSSSARSTPACARRPARRRASATRS